MAHLQQHGGLPVPAGVLALQVMAEEPLLQPHPIIRVELGPVLDPVQLEPLLARGRAHEAFHVAAQVQPLAAPVAGREQRHGDPVPDRRAVAVIGIVERVGQDVAAEFRAVGGELLLAQRLRPAYQLAGYLAARPVGAAAVLHRLDLHVVPVLPEGAEDASVARHVAVPVGCALPDAHGGEVRRLQRGDVPLVDGVIGDAVEADLAVAPGLFGGPFDAVVEILRLARREMVDVTGRAAAAAGVDAHAGIAVRHPFLRVDHLPVLVLVGRAGGHVRVLLGHPVPGAGIALLEGEALAVGPIGQDHRIAAVLGRAEHVGPQHQPVVHLDRHVPVDAHAVPDLALEFAHAPCPPMCSFLPARSPSMRAEGVAIQYIPDSLDCRVGFASSQ